MRLNVTVRQLDRIVGFLAGLLLLPSLAALAWDVGRVSTEVLALTLAYMVTIAAGDLWRVSVPGSREFAPVAVAASLAWAMTPGLPSGQDLHHHVALVIVGTGLASFAGTAVRSSLSGDALAGHDVALRILVVAVAVGLYRVVPVPFGEATLVEHTSRWQDGRWLGGLLMIVVATVAVGVHLAARSLGRAVRHHAELWHSVVHEVAAAHLLALATAVTASMVALGVGVMGWVAVPLFVVPLVILQIAVAQQSAVRGAQRQTLWALSRLTDEGGFTRAGHGARVARLAVPIGRQLGLPERELPLLECAALLHDIGQVSLRRPIPGGATVHTAPIDQSRIAATGAAILSRTAELSRVAHLVRDQAAPYRRGVDVTEVPVSARILKVANAFDDLVGDDAGPATTQRAVAQIGLSTGYEYDPVVVRALCRVLEREGRLSSDDRARLDW